MGGCGGGGGGRGGGYWNKVALAHFDPFDLLKLNYSDPRTLEHGAARSAVCSGGERKNQAGNRPNCLIIIILTLIDVNK